MLIRNLAIDKKNCRRRFWLRRKTSVQAESSEVSVTDNFHQLHKDLILAMVVVQGGVLALCLVPGLRPGASFKDTCVKHIVLIASLIFDF
jgi:hypothetical protein